MQFKIMVASAYTDPEGRNMETGKDRGKHIK